ncbi:MAG: FkbM family methyltransferase [Planctomycetia bacterium]|nr:FkbM family methyltransferase [Planctomycetia bacterium]
MVEVGGGTPEFLSMSKHFKDSGWRAIVVEPNPALLPPTATRRQVTVDVRRLDGLLDDLGISRVDLLSVDVEGWELEVMRGLDTKRIDCPVIVLENFNHDPSYAASMREVGYGLARTIEYNYVFTKPAGRPSRAERPA